MTNTVACQLPLSRAFDNNGLILAAGLLHTYQAGSLTPLPTYQTLDTSAPNTNPVVFDSTGQQIIRYLPGVAYKLVLKDPTDTTTLDSVDNFYAPLTNQFDVGTVLYPPLVPAENGITIVQPQYPPGVFERYGVNTTPFVTSCTAAIQAAINQAKAGGADVVIGTTGGALIDGALDLTTPVGQTRYAITIRGVRNLGAFTNNSPYYPTILLKHTGIGFDNTGCAGVNYANLSIGTDLVTYPKIGILLARNTDAQSQQPRFFNVQMFGNFKIAALYNYGSEDSEHHGCQFWNFASDLGAKAMVFTGTNYLYGVTSTFTTILGSGASHGISTQDHKFFGGTYYLNQGSANLTSVAITGIAGQFSCAAASLAIGQPVAISGTYGGTGSITGYVSPTVYFISATNGSTTFTLKTAAGTALVTNAGTPTGLTYAAQTSDAIYLESVSNFRMYAPWAYCAATGVNPGRSILYIDTKNAPSVNITLDGLMSENQAPNQQNFTIFIGNEGAAGSANVTNISVRGGGTSANVASIYNSAASNLSSVFWWQNSVQATPFGLINDGTVIALFSDTSLPLSGGAGAFSRSIATLNSNGLAIQGTGDAYLSLSDLNSAANSKIWNLRSTASSLALTLANDSNVNTTTVWQITRTGTTLGGMSLTCSLGVNGAAAPGQVTGWGTPVGGAVVANYNITDAGGANSNTNKAVAEIIAYLKSRGDFAT